MHRPIIIFMQGYASKNHLPFLTRVTIVGVATKPTVVSLDGKSYTFTATFVGDTIVLVVPELSISMDTNFALTWI